MIAIDTNVLVRLYMVDDADQYKAARALLDQLTQERPGFISREVLVEFAWVLRRRYHLAREEMFQAILGLVEARTLALEQSDDVIDSIALAEERGIDFADAMIAAAARRAGASELVTFDKRLAGLPNARLL